MGMFSLFYIIFYKGNSLIKLIGTQVTYMNQHRGGL